MQEVCSNEGYLIGVVGGMLVGWVFGQMWQSFNDRHWAKYLLSLIDLEEEDRNAVLKTENEAEQLFDETVRTVEEIRDIGRQTGSEPVRFPVAKGGGYVTNSEIEEVSKKSKNFDRLSRGDELDIMHTFKGIIGMGFFRAQGAVEEQGYSLHPIYINDGPKNPTSTYSATTLGVKVKDSLYDFCDTDKGLSCEAVITEIVDVGGQDPHGRGIITL